METQLGQRGRGWSTAERTPAEDAHCLFGLIEPGDEVIVGVNGVFGTAKWMAAQAGRATSPAKAAAARANGRKGGRPRKAG